MSKHYFVAGEMVGVLFYTDRYFEAVKFARGQFDKCDVRTIARGHKVYSDGEISRHLYDETALSSLNPVLKYDYEQWLEKREWREDYYLYSEDKEPLLNLAVLANLAGIKITDVEGFLKLTMTQMDEVKLWCARLHLHASDHIFRRKSLLAPVFMKELYEYD